MKFTTTALITIASFTSLIAQPSATNCAVLTINAAAAPANKASQTWKKVDGSTFEASYVSSEKGKVTFLDKDGNKLKMKKKELDKDSKRKVNKLEKAAVANK